jgi:hypothetical protein
MAERALLPARRPASETIEPADAIFLAILMSDAYIRDA